MSFAKPVFQWLSPAGRRAHLSVLIFHRVLPQIDDLFPDEMHVERFDAVCAWLKSWFNVMPLDEAVRGLTSGELPSRACCITFDDGYADNHDIALPILEKHGLTATFFVATGFLDGGRMWNDTVIEAVRYCRHSELAVEGIGQYPLGDAIERRCAVDSILGALKYLAPAERSLAADSVAAQAGIQPANDLMMSFDQVRRMRQAGMQIGAHTVTHPILARLGFAQAHHEIAESRRELEALLGERIGLFAYPNGRPATDYLPEHAELVRDLGFDAAVSTAWGAATAGADRFQVPRFTPWDRSRFKFGLRMMRNLASAA